MARRPPDTYLAWAIILWTLIAWGGRIGLLTGGEDLWGWIRIVGSLALAGAAGAVLLVPAWSRYRRPVLLLFSAWTSVIWSRSMFVNWVESGTVAFKLVHTALALGFLVLVVWSVRATTRRD